MSNSSILLMSVCILIVTLCGIILYKIKERRTWEKSLKLPVKKIKDFALIDTFVVRKTPTFNGHTRIIAQLVNDYSKDLENGTPKAYTNAFVIQGVESNCIEGVGSHWGITVTNGVRIFTPDPFKNKQIIIQSTAGVLKV